MVTFLESGLIGYFNPLFVFLFILVAVYALLNTVNIFGKNAFVNGIISFIFAIMFATSARASKIVEYSTPWIILLFVVLFFLMLLFKFLSGDEKVNPLSLKNTTLVTIIYVFILLIFILAAGQVSKEKKEADQKAGIEPNPVLSFPARVGATVRDPAVLGLIIIMFIAVFAIMMLASGPSK